MHQKNVSFATIGFLKILDLNLKNLFVMDVSGCHDLLMMAYSLKNIVILRAKGATFRCALMGTSKNKALKILDNLETYDRGVL